MPNPSRLPAPLLQNWAWQAEAVCREVGSEPFFGPAEEEGAGAGRNATGRRSRCADRAPWSKPVCIMPSPRTSPMVSGAASRPRSAAGSPPPRPWRRTCRPDPGDGRGQACRAGPRRVARLSAGSRHKEHTSHTVPTRTGIARPTREIIHGVRTHGGSTGPARRPLRPARGLPPAGRYRAPRAGPGPRGHRPRHGRHGHRHRLGRPRTPRRLQRGPRHRGRRVQEGGRGRPPERHPPRAAAARPPRGLRRREPGPALRHRPGEPRTSPRPGPACPGAAPGVPGRAARPGGRSSTGSAGGRRRCCARAASC